MVLCVVVWCGMMWCGVSRWRRHCTLRPRNAWAPLSIFPWVVVRATAAHFWRGRSCGQPLQPGKPGSFHKYLAVRACCKCKLHVPGRRHSFKRILCVSERRHTPFPCLASRSSSVDIPPHAAADKMRGPMPLARVAGRPLGTGRIRPSRVCLQCRAIQISAAPTTESPRTGGDAFGAPAQGFRDTAGTFMVLAARRRENG